MAVRACREVDVQVWRRPGAAPARSRPRLDPLVGERPVRDTITTRRGGGEPHEVDVVEVVRPISGATTAHVPAQPREQVRGRLHHLARRALPGRSSESMAAASRAAGAGASGCPRTPVALVRGIRPALVWGCVGSRASRGPHDVAQRGRREGPVERPGQALRSTGSPVAIWSWIRDFRTSRLRSSKSVGLAPCPGEGTAPPGNYTRGHG